MASFTEASRYLIRGGELVTENGLQKKDLLIEQGKIVAWLDPGQSVDTDVVLVERSECLVLPGGIDPHVHFNFTFHGKTTLHTASSGGIAALYSGTTTVFDFVLDEDGAIPPDELIAARRKEFSSAPVDVHFHYCFLQEHTKVEEFIPKLPSLGIKVAIPGFYYGWEECKLERYMPLFKQNGLWLGLHAMEEELTPLKQWYDCNLHQFVERRDIFAQAELHLYLLYGRLANQYNIPFYAFHQSNPAVLSHNWDHLHAIEVNVHHLYYNLNHMLDRPDGKLLMCGPPLQTADMHSLLASQLDRIHVVASDDAAFSRADKESADSLKDVVKGMPSVGYRLPLLYTHGVKKGLIEWEKFLDLWCVRAAKIFQLYPQKGTLQPGADADVVVLHPGKIIRETNPADQNMGWQPFLDKLDGWPCDVFRKGKWMIKHGNYIGN